MLKIKRWAVIGLIGFTGFLTQVQAGCTVDLKNNRDAALILKEYKTFQDGWSNVKQGDSFPAKSTKPLTLEGPFTAIFYFTFAEKGNEKLESFVVVNLEDCDPYSTRTTMPFEILYPPQFRKSIAISPAV